MYTRKAGTCLAQLCIGGNANRHKDLTETQRVPSLISYKRLDIISAQYTKQTRSTSVISPPRIYLAFFRYGLSKECSLGLGGCHLKQKVHPQQIQISGFILNWQCVLAKKLQILTFEAYRSTNYLCF